MKRQENRFRRVVILAFSDFFSVFRVLILADLHQIRTKNLLLVTKIKSLQMESLKMLPRKCWMVWSLIQIKKMAS